MRCFISYIHSLDLETHSHLDGTYLYNRLVDNEIQSQLELV